MKKNASIVDLDKDYVERLLNELYDKGYRVVAIAEKPIEKKETYGKEDEKDLTLIGFLCFNDLVKQGIKKVVRNLRNMELN
jgi:Mg2+-importing ATPase